MGNVVIVSRAADPTYVDEIGRIVLARGGHLGANCHHPMSGRAAEGIHSVPGTFSRPLALGRAVRGGGGSGPAAARRRWARTAVPRSVVAPCRRRSTSGSTSRAVRASRGPAPTQARRRSCSSRTRPWRCFRDGSLRGAVPRPDLLLEPRSGRGLMSVELTVGMEVALLARTGAPAAPEAVGDRARGARRSRRHGTAGPTWVPPIEELRG